MSNAVRISVSTTGEIRINGQVTSLDQTSAKLSELKKSNGAVHYYRENPEGEPHPNALKVMQLVIDNQLPVRLCTKPDFSD